jgi:DNA-binding transcriptional MerR regulator
MSPADVADSIKIGEVAERLGTTARTIRYYEEIGLLPGPRGRKVGKHRLYTEADVERLARILELKRLLGLSLDQLKSVLEAEEARAGLRRRWEHTEDATERLRIVEEALGHVGRQLDLVRERQAELGKLEDELRSKRSRLRRRRKELEGATKKVPAPTAN